MTSSCSSGFYPYNKKRWKLEDFIYKRFVWYFSLDLNQFPEKPMSDNKITAANINIKIDPHEPSLKDDINTKTNIKIDDPHKPSLEDDINTKTVPTFTPSSPSKRKSSTTKMTCLCAPTNHPGSFRCRLHRNSASVGSNLSELGNRKTASVGANLHLLGETKTTTN